MAKKVLFLLALVAFGGAALADPPPAGPPPAAPPGAPAAAQKPAPPLTSEQAADAVLAALTAKDDAALKALASKDAPDPWFVADELIARAAFDAADAFAKAAPRKDVERLPEYVASRRGKTNDAAARTSLAAANAALAAKKPKDALDALGPAGAAAPDDVVGIRRAFGRGVALAAMGRMEEGSASSLVAADAAERLGWLSRAFKALQDAGVGAYRRSDFRGALASWERARVIAETRGDRAGAAATLGNIGLLHQSLGDFPKALDAYERAMALLDALGNRAGVAAILGNIGAIEDSLGNYPKALEVQERALKLREDLGDLASVAGTLGNIGIVHQRLGNLPTALEYQDRALQMMVKLGNRAGEANTLGNIGLVHYSLGNYAKSLEYGGRALAIKEELRDRAGAALALASLGNVHYSLGGYLKAIEFQERALRIEEDVGNRAGIATRLGSLGIVHASLGNYPKALEYDERALAKSSELGDKLGVATALASIGAVHESIGNPRKALDWYQRALKAMDELGSRAGSAATLGNIGNIQHVLGHDEQALEVQQRAQKLKEDLGDRAGAATTLSSIGLVYASLGDRTKALDCYARALRTMEEVGDRAGVAMALGRTGSVHFALGDVPKALEHFERAVALARDIGDRNSIVRGLWGIADCHMRLGSLAQATRSAADAIEAMSGLVSGLADEQGASAREQFAPVFELGVRATKGLGDAPGAFFFLESGRAGTLLEGLGGRGRLRGHLVPEELRVAESSARAREALARAAFRKGSDAGSDLAQLRRLRADLDTERDAVAGVIDRIQRDAKRAADVVYPKAAALSAIQSRLGEEEALVLYGLFPEDAMALVVTGKDARIVELGATKPIEAAYEAAMPGVLDAGLPVNAARLDSLRDLAVKPLGLRLETKRVLVSLHGLLSYAPVSMLFPDREVVEVPSGTTYRLLTDDRSQTGEGVLALGDPDVDARPDPAALALFVEGVRARGGTLGRLPSSREEAKAVGDVLLIDKDASEDRLREALAKRPRWRSVHFACHGLVDPERPTLSSLALTPSGGDDGFLTALDVFRMTIPADLVVLSACETGKGKVYGSEGIVGLTRAFMFAGSPRVLCSLWKVDDAATRELMTKFYALWNPKDGSKPMGAAAALVAAQAYVRTHEADVPDVEATQREGHAVTRRVRHWEHPYFWAAWVLWGLSD
jgi:tetratricopeptide (TPR) repeat protein